MARVERLLVRVTLDDPEPTLKRTEAAAAAGDESWEQWLTEYRRGEAIIVRLDVTLEASGESGSDIIEVTNCGVFLETDAQPPKVEYQVAELVGKDVPMLVRELEARGHDIEESDLHEMFVHVELGQNVRRSLTEARLRRDDPRSDARLAKGEVSPSDPG